MTLQADLRKAADDALQDEKRYIAADFVCAANHIDKLEGEASVMRAILKEADSVLSTIEPSDTTEAQALGELRRKISQLFAPVESTLL